MVTDRENQQLLPEDVASQYVEWHNWRYAGKVGPKPPGGALSVWEEWIATDPERAWAVVLELVRLRPVDDEILEQVWYRMQELLRRHGKAYHKRILALVQANARLRRIARPHELELSHYYPPPLDLPRLADTWLQCSIHGPDAHELRELIRHDPDAAWPVVIEIVNRGPLHGLDAFRTMSPLRDLLRRHGTAVIDRLEEIAADSVLIRRCLWRMKPSQGIPPTEFDIPADVWRRVERATNGTTDYNTDDPVGREQKLTYDAERVVGAWFAYEAVFWASERLQDLLAKDPEVAWRTIVLLIERAPSDERLGPVGAGPLEDLLNDHGDMFIDRIEAAARTDSRFRACLASVWQRGMSEALWERVVAARGASWE